MISVEERRAVHRRTQAVAAEDARAEAFAGLVDHRALDAAYRYATLMLGDRADAEDATHDAALTAWRRFGDLRDPARFDAWFGRILVNACRDRLRARRRRLAPLAPGASADQDPWDGGTAPTSAGSGADFADALARRMALADALRSLSVEHRETVVLRFYADLTVDQIAQRTGVGSGTVKSRLHYALRRLRDAVGAQAGEVRDER